MAPIHHAERPARLLLQRIALVAGAVTAWPVVGLAAPSMVVAVAALSAVWLAALAMPRAAWSRQGVIGAAIGLYGLSISQRLYEPGLALVEGIGLVLLVLLVQGKGAVSHHAPPERFLSLVALLLGSVVLSLPDQVGLPRPLAFVVVAALVLHHRIRSGQGVFFGGADVVDTVMASPARVLVTTFAAITFVGTLLLLLPGATVQPIAVLDALFTATSAVCVTGLIVLDTPNVFTGFGQFWILVLIQIGGLGIMTFAAAGAIYLGRRLGVREEAVAASMLGGDSTRRDLEAALRTVLSVTFVTEIAGVVLLTPAFLWHGDGPLTALWRAVFTAVSAFCNAGFALQSDSLVPYQSSASVLLVVSGLIVVGGLGPLVVAGVVLRQRLTLHARLVLATTAGLLVLPAIAILVFEWGSASMDGLGFVDKVVNAWFQSVTLRTAGFNSLDLSIVRSPTWTLMVVCMFVGGSPGSTAGGVKTTTIAVLLLAVSASIQGRGEAEAFGRRLPHKTVYEAAAISTVAVLAVVVVLACLQVTQDLPLEQVLFETVSALATVGLSTGATAALDDVGKLLVILAMFAGRVGPLTLFIFLSWGERSGGRFPIESVTVG